MLFFVHLASVLGPLLLEPAGNGFARATGTLVACDGSGAMAAAASSFEAGQMAAPSAGCSALPTCSQQVIMREYNPYGI